MHQSVVIPQWARWVFPFVLTALTLFPTHAAKAKAKSISVKKTKKWQYSYSYRVKGKRYQVLSKKSALHYDIKGIASWYGGKFHGRKTANGTRYNMNTMTAASKTLPLGSEVTVTNLSNHRSVTVKITDRGPFIKGRIIDLSALAAKKLGFKNKGITQVRVSVISV